MAQTIECEVPLTLRLSGQPSEDDWSALQTALTAQYENILRRSLTHMAQAGHVRPFEPVREQFDPRRLGPDGYVIPSYQNAQPTQVPLQANPQPSDDPTVDEIARTIAERFPDTHGRPANGVHYGLYVRRQGASQVEINYLEERPQGLVLKAASLWSEVNGQRAAITLAPGTYTLLARPHGQAQLYGATGAVVSDVNNLDNADLAVSFYVPVPAGGAPPAPAPPHYRFYPRLQILRVNAEPQLATGQQATFIGEVEIWRLDGSSWSPVFGLALIYAFINFHWEIWKIIPGARPGEPEQKTQIHTLDSRYAFLHFVFTQAGSYEIRCSVSLDYEDASPDAVTTTRRESVVALEVKMALQLAQLEAAQQAALAAGNTSQLVWVQSASALLESFRRQLQQEQNATRRNDAKIRALQDAIADLERQLVNRTGAGPFPIHAIFTERETSQSRPISLFLGPATAPTAGAAHTWYLIDVTYPAFYATYTGTGQTVGEAIRAAFERSRSSFRGKYPPGRILAHIDWPGMDAAYNLQPFDFAIETESWQRTAYEWLTFGAEGLAAIGLAASFVFPPSAFVTGMLVVGAVAGATVSAVNIAERLDTNSFQWDAEAVTDIVNIAASFAFVGGAWARGAASGLTRAVAAGEPLTISAASRLSQLLRFSRAMLYMGLTADLSNGVILSWDTYTQLRDIDAAVGQDTLSAYQRIYGTEEGRRRWETERYTRILGILARAAVNGLLIAVSVRGEAEALGQRQALLRQPRIPGADRPVSSRLEVTPAALATFPDAAFAQDRAGFRRAQVDLVAQRLGVASTHPEISRLSPQSAWQFNAAWEVMNEAQRRMLVSSLRGPQDFPALTRFLRAGGNLQELGAFLSIQPSMIRDGIGSFDTLANRYRDFQHLRGTVPDLSTFHWDPANLELHFRRHVLGEAGYADEAWKWVQRLGIAQDLGLDRAAFDSLVRSTAPQDVARRQNLMTQYQQAYGDYVRTVLARSNVFVRSARGAELVGSDGELVWFAGANGTISSGYFPESPTARAPGGPNAPRGQFGDNDLQGIFLDATRSGQSVFLLFQARF